MWNGGRTVRNVCEWCDSEFFTHPGSNNPNKYCSWGCTIEARTGENSPKYKGGKFPYGPGWNDAKKELVRERDGHECRICGKAEADHIKDIGRKLTIHHIVKARRLQDAPAEVRNGPFNLVTICNSHNNPILEQIPPWVQFMAFLPHPPLPTEQPELAAFADQ